MNFGIRLLVLCLINFNQYQVSTRTRISSRTRINYGRLTTVGWWRPTIRRNAAASGSTLECSWRPLAACWMSHHCHLLQWWLHLSSAKLPLDLANHVAKQHKFANQVALEPLQAHRFGLGGPGASPCPSTCRFEGHKPSPRGARSCLT